MSTYLLPSNASTQAVFAALSALSTTTTTTSPSQNNATPQVKNWKKIIAEIIITSMTTPLQSEAHF